MMASAIFYRQGDESYTSTAEAFFESAAGVRHLLFIKWCVPGELKATIGFDSLSEMELSSILLWILGGNALRIPATGGGDTCGLDGFLAFFVGCFFTILKAISSNS
jgi:hypothetical protein